MGHKNLAYLLIAIISNQVTDLEIALCLAQGRFIPLLKLSSYLMFVLPCDHPSYCR